MYTFAQNPKAMQQNALTKSLMPGRGHFGFSHEMKSFHQLPHTIGNQAQQQMPQLHGDEPTAGLSNMASPRFDHDFSQIPIHAPAAGDIQSNPAINKQKGESEHEADQITSQMTQQLPPIPLPTPRLNLKGFNISSPSRSTRPGRKRKRYDKSRRPDRPEQDGALSVSNFGTRSGGGSGGVDIDLDASTAGTTAAGVAGGAIAGSTVAGLGLGIAAAAGAALSGGLIAGVLLGGALVGGLIGGLVGGYRYTQTIDTNVPLGGTTSPYVDPRPNDDNKPFYWTDAEEASMRGRFHDSPSRGVPGASTTNWDAVVSITSVTGKSVRIMDSLKYGFSIDTAGNVTPRRPAAASGGDVGTHVATLTSEFPDWSFSR
jgi:hypothetical protein